MDTAVQKRDSNKMELVRMFKYRGVDVVIRKWCGICYEFLLSVDGNIYCDYYEMETSTALTTSQRKKENDDLENQIVSNLCSSATATIDYHKKGRIQRKIKKLTTNITNNVKQFWINALKQKEPANATSGEEVSVS